MNNALQAPRKRPPDSEPGSASCTPAPLMDALCISTDNPTPQECFQYPTLDRDRRYCCTLFGISTSRSPHQEHSLINYQPVPQHVSCKFMTDQFSPCIPNHPLGNASLHPALHSTADRGVMWRILSALAFGRESASIELHQSA